MSINLDLHSLKKAKLGSNWVIKGKVKIDNANYEFTADSKTGQIIGLIEDGVELDAARVRIIGNNYDFGKVTEILKDISWRIKGGRVDISDGIVTQYADRFGWITLFYKGDNISYNLSSGRAWIRDLTLRKDSKAFEPNEHFLQTVGVWIQKDVKNAKSFDEWEKMRELDRKYRAKARERADLKISPPGTDEGYGTPRNGWGR